MFTKTYLNQITILASEISSKGHWIAEDVFNDEALGIIASEYNKHLNEFKPAHIGKGQLKNNNSLIRNDKNFWLDQGDHANLTPVWHLLSNITSELKLKLFLPIKRFETQFALYPPGHFYKRHVDKHKLMPARLLTLVYYISDWKEEHKGELVIYGENNIYVKPKKNSLVIFLSELEHEVLPTQTHRKSLTAWFRDDIL